MPLQSTQPFGLKEEFSWISVLEAFSIVRALEPYCANIGKRLVKTPRLYMLDTGLARYLAGIRTSSDLRNRLATIDHHGYEVDFLVAVGENLKLIKCKWSETSPFNLKGFEEVALQLGEKNTFLEKHSPPPRVATAHSKISR